MSIINDANSINSSDVYPINLNLNGENKKSLSELSLDDFKAFLASHPIKGYLDGKDVVQFYGNGLNIGNDFVGNVGRRQQNIDRNNDIRNAFYKAIRNEYGNDSINIPNTVREALKMNNYEYDSGKVTSGKPLTLRRIHKVLVEIDACKAKNKTNIKESSESEGSQEATNLVAYKSNFDFKSCLPVFEEAVSSEVRKEIAYQDLLGMGFSCGEKVTDSVLQKSILDKLFKECKDGYKDLQEKLRTDLKKEDERVRFLRSIFYLSVKQKVDSEKNKEVDFTEWPKKLQDAFGIDTYKFDRGYVTSSKELKYEDISNVIDILKDLQKHMH